MAAAPSSGSRRSSRCRARRARPRPRPRRLRRQPTRRGRQPSARSPTGRSCARRSRGSTPSTATIAAPPRDAPIDRAGRGVDVAVRVGVDGARIENDLARFGLEARAVLPWRLDVEARARWYHESLAGPDADLWLSGLDLGVRALQFANVAARVGVGARWLHDDGGDEGGGVVAAALDIYPVKPVLIEASAGAGVIGGASLRELRLGAGAVIGAAEIAAGWERVAIGTVPLDGPYLALRWWL